MNIVSEFQLLNKIEHLNHYADKYILSSFPKVHLALKIKLENNLYGLVENTIRANINKGSIRNKYQKEILINVSLIDYYLTLVLHKNLIQKKRFIAFTRALSEIRKMTYGWMSSEEKE